MKLKNVLLFSVFSMMITSVSAYGETIQGEIKQISPDSASFVLKPDPAGAAGKPELTITVGNGTRFTGLNSLKELAPGDEVTVEARKKQDETWEADAVKISKVKIQEPVAKLDYTGTSQKR